MYLSLYKQIIDKDGNIFTGLLKKESDIFRNYLFFLLVFNFSRFTRVLCMSFL